MTQTYDPALVERIQDMLAVPGYGTAIADDIRSLIGWCEELQAALTPFASICADHGETFEEYPPSIIIRCQASAGEIQRARAALRHGREQAR